MSAWSVQLVHHPVSSSCPFTPSRLPLPFVLFLSLLLPLPFSVTLILACLSPPLLPPHTSTLTTLAF
ncbi:hypothetical protein BLNAU_22714 [Blattamonas nauphoetae]|uniref:Uncharacterized protein n=1 Tax=Blattamonas nauphoetae TaxID=2049346 RepID=A0ABQ9WVB2_9EUKA|nr:hypothetical protein BLNAU_22714 [Blattamonas nauphoetae]